MTSADPASHAQLEVAAQLLANGMIVRQGGLPGNYLLILKVNVSAGEGPPLWTWDWYWRPETAEEKEEKS